MRRCFCIPSRPTRPMQRLKKVYQRGRTAAKSSTATTLVSVAVDKGVFAELTSSVGAAPCRTGVLLKYTNVVKGWKRRLFTLENGVLLYGAAADDDDRPLSVTPVSEAIPDRRDHISAEFHAATNGDIPPSTGISTTKKTRSRIRTTRRLLRRHGSKEEKERDIKGRINLQFAVIMPDDTDPCRFAIDVGHDVYHCKAETEEERNSWVDILNESNAYFKGLIKNATSRAKERPPGPDEPRPNTETPRESRSEESDESVLEDDGLREAEESRKALMGELRHVVDFWRGNWIDSSGGIAVNTEDQFMNTLADAFSCKSKSSQGKTDFSATAKSLLDLTAWSLQVLTTNDEMYDRRLKADLARIMGRAVPVYPQEADSEEHPHDRIYREGEYTDGDSDAELEFFDALSRSVSMHSHARILSSASMDKQALLEAKAASEEEAQGGEPTSETRKSGKLRRVETEQLTHIPRARARLPELPSPREKLNIWSIVKDAVGKDLSKISVPVVVNEPMSFVQRLAEDVEYSELFDKAAENPDPFERLMYVAAAVASHYSSTLGRGGKPFNPLLGETYELVLPNKGNGLRFVAEQVSHHPPISACYAEGSGGTWKYYNAIEIKNKFWGKSLEFFPVGLNHVEIPEYGDHYVFEQATACVHNIVVGRMWLDNYGDIEIVDRTSRNKCVLTLNKTGWMSDARWFASIKAVITDPSGKVHIKMGGNWNERVYRDLGKGKQETIWMASERPPSAASNGYNWTKWAISLNEPVPDDVRKHIAPTDSRLRPDQRALEIGDVDAAAEFKSLLEEGQRERRRLREEAAEEYTPLWFSKVVDEETGRDYYSFTGEYFHCKSEMDWSRCPDIFSCATETDDA